MASSCCKITSSEGPSHHHHDDKGRDWLFWGGLAVIIISILASFFIKGHSALSHFVNAVQDIAHDMWWGVVIGMVFVGIASQIPRSFIISIFGRKTGFKGILRATFAGVLLDLCSHGILMVGAKLYERGISNGQLIAFLVASPWNSLSLTLILWSLIGLKLTLIFLFLSMIVGIITGLIFDYLTAKGTLPPSPYRQENDLNEDFDFWAEAKKSLKAHKFDQPFMKNTIRAMFTDSQMILRWLFWGIVLAALVRSFVTPEMLSTYFGPTMLGLFLTLIAATVIEVCSEGSAPMASDLVTRAGAAGNGFTFLMAGVSTDYTEIMVLREVTKSTKFALFLPLITIPQILILGYILNSY